MNCACKQPALLAANTHMLTTHSAIMLSGSSVNFGLCSRIVSALCLLKYFDDGPRMTEEVSNKANNRSYGIFWRYLLCSVATSVALVGLAALAFLHIFDFAFLEDAACREVDASKYYNEFTYCFYGSDWDEEKYLATVSGFYSSLVAVLVAVQALISALSFVVIKTSNKGAIEEEVEKEVPKYFATVAAVDQVKGFVRETAGSAFDQKLDALKNEITGLKGRLEELQEQVFEIGEKTMNGDTEEALTFDDDTEDEGQ